MEKNALIKIEIMQKKDENNFNKYKFHFIFEQNEYCRNLNKTLKKCKMYLL